MATRKCEVIVRRLVGGNQNQYLRVFADPEAEDVIAKVEGVMESSFTTRRAHLVLIDPRYDVDEVAASIEGAIKGALLLEQWTQQEPEPDQEVPE